MARQRHIAQQPGFGASYSVAAQLFALRFWLNLALRFPGRTTSSLLLRYRHFLLLCSCAARTLSRIMQANYSFQQTPVRRPPFSKLRGAGVAKFLRYTA